MPTREVRITDTILRLGSVDGVEEITPLGQAVAQERLGNIIEGGNTTGKIIVLDQTSWMA